MRAFTGRVPVLVLSVGLPLLSAALLLKGTIQFFAPGAGQDFWYRWSAQQYVTAHVDPFRVAFYASDHDGQLPSDIPHDLAEQAGNPISVVDPPWVFAFNIPLYPSSKSLAPIEFVVLQYFALVITAFCIVKISQPLPPKSTIFLIALFFASQAFGETILNGNLGNFAVAAIASCFALGNSKRWYALALSLALAQVKTTISAPLALTALAQRRFRVLCATGAILALAAAWTRSMLGIEFVGLFQRMMEGVGRYSVGGLSPHKGLMALGMDKSAALIVSAVGVLALAMVLNWQWRGDSIALMGIFAVCSRVFTYHLVIDNVVIAFLVLALGMTWLERPRLTWAGWVAGGVVISVLLPARLTEITWVGLVQQLVWVLALGVLLRARRQLVSLTMRCV